MLRDNLRLQTRRKLREMESAAAIVRHLSVMRLDAFLSMLEYALRREKPEMPEIRNDSSSSGDFSGVVPPSSYVCFDKGDSPIRDEPDVDVTVVEPTDTMASCSHG